MKTFSDPRILVNTPFDTTAPIILLADLPEEPVPFTVYDLETKTHGWADPDEVGEAIGDWLYAYVSRFPVGTVFRLVASEAMEEISTQFHPYLGNI